MSGAYRLAPAAQEDVEDLLDYIAADDFETALRVDEELTDTFLLLAVNRRRNLSPIGVQV